MALHTGRRVPFSQIQQKSMWKLNCPKARCAALMVSKDMEEQSEWLSHIQSQRLLFFPLATHIAIHSLALTPLAQALPPTHFHPPPCAHTVRTHPPSRMPPHTATHSLAPTPSAPVRASSHRIEELQFPFPRHVFV